jgi:hypothetical protein
MVTPSDVIDAQLEAYNARDLERFLGCFAASIIVTDSSGNVLADGFDGLREMYGPLFDASPQLNASIASRIVVGNYVVDHEKVTGFVRPGFPTALEAIAGYEVVDGAITKEWLFF